MIDSSHLLETLENLIDSVRAGNTMRFLLAVDDGRVVTCSSAGSHRDLAYMIFKVGDHVARQMPQQEGLRDEND